MIQYGIEWAPVDGFPGYEVSSCGQIRSLRRRIPKVMRTETDRDGYRRVSLFDGKSYTHKLIHRLVAEAFIGPAPADMPICCHNDGDVSNNNVTNLRWATQAQNIADKVRHGTLLLGSKHPLSITDEVQIAGVKRFLRMGMNCSEASRKTGVSVHIVRDVARGRSWGHVQ